MHMQASLCVFLAATLSTFYKAGGIELSLDLDLKVLPGGQSTCGVLRCVEAGSEPRLTHISHMTLFKTAPGFGPRTRSTVGSVSQRWPNVSTLWNGVKVDGTWSKQETTLTLYLVEQEDCRSAQFSCEVRYVDGLGEDRVISAQIGKSGKPQAQRVDSHSGSPSQLTLMLQQSSSALEGTRQQLNSRLEDNLRYLEKRMEDKISVLNNAMLKLESKMIADGGVDKTERRTSSNNMLEDQIVRASSVFGELAENMSVLDGKVKDILHREAEDFGLRSHNVSGEILNKVLEMVANGELVRADQIKTKGQASLVQQNSCKRQDGEYRVVISEDEPPYLCDGQLEGGGWIVIQRRSSGSVNFFRNWDAYRDGFGSLADDFWLGNERVHALTSQDNYELMVRMSFEGKWSFARYDFFSVGDEASNYTLGLGTYSGTAGDSLGPHRGAAFSTFDRDHDKSSANCARMFLGAWWYQSCHSSNLNGKWGALKNKGPRWSGLSNDNPVTFSEMKIRLL